MCAACRGRAGFRTVSSDRRMSQASSFSRTLSRHSTRRNSNTQYDSPGSWSSVDALILAVLQLVLLML